MFIYTVVDSVLRGVYAVVIALSTQRYRRCELISQKLKTLCTVLIILITFTAQAQQAPDNSNLSASYSKISDLNYAVAGDYHLLLDVYLPKDAINPPLIVYIHGGAWRSGSKDSVPIMPLIEDGFALASVEFRMSEQAMFPAQMHDLKAAIRFLRGNAKQLGYNANKIGVLGSSSGGHLAALMGVSNGDAALEGELGEYRDQSSAVQAVVSYFGASNLTSILDQSTPFGLNVRVPALDLFIGGQPADQTELARLASPVFHVDADSAPLFMLHGDQDPQMPINQSHELHSAYKQHGVPVQFEVVHGSAHGGAAFYDASNNALVSAFLNTYLR